MIKIKFADLRLALEEISDAKTEFMSLDISSTNNELFLGFTTIDKINKSIKIWSSDHNITPEITETKKLYKRS